MPMYRRRQLPSALGVRRVSRAARRRVQNIWPARSYSLHANAYVTKPTDFDRFMDTIGQIDDFTSPW